MALEFDFPVGEDPREIAEHIERVVETHELGGPLPKAPIVEGTPVFNSADVVQEYLDKDPSAKFLGDDLVIDNKNNTITDDAAIKGVETTVLARELSVSLETGAIAESVVAVQRDHATPNGAVTNILKSRWLRRPSEA